MKVIDAKTCKKLALPGRNVTFIATPRSCGIQEMVVCLTEIPQGSELPYHTHDGAAEVMYVESGTGEAVIDDAVCVVHEGSTICVPKAAKHTVRNTGTGSLHMVCAFSPAIDTSAYESQAK